MREKRKHKTLIRISDVGEYIALTRAIGKVKLRRESSLLRNARPKRNS